MRIIFTIIMLLLTGCVSYTPSVPQGYTGATTTIDDSFQRHSRSKANLFYIKLIDEKPIHNGLVATSSASYGKGSQLIAMGASRPVPIQPLTLYIVGQVHHSAPVGYMFGAGSNYIVEGEVNFTPESGAKYLINGTLSETYSAVWVEDINGNIVSKVIEKKTAAHVGKDNFENIPKKQALSREELFLNLVSGESVGLVTEKLGEPDAISMDDGSFFKERPPSVTYRYEGLGSIVFTSKSSKAQFIEKIMPISKQSDDISSIKMQLNSEGSTLQHLAKSYYQLDEMSTERLDLIAAKIWSEKSTEDPYTLDALSWLCKVLAKSNNPRYRSLLKEVANEAGSNKLRKYARNSLQSLPAEEAPQFIPSEK